MLMALDEEANSEPEEPMPGMATEDPRTYDPTQGRGTDAWQAAVKRQMELNARDRRN